jgi:hypothetical protein
LATLKGVILYAGSPEIGSSPSYLLSFALFLLIGLSLVAILRREGIQKPTRYPHEMAIACYLATLALIWSGALEAMLRKITVIQWVLGLTILGAILNITGIVTTRRQSATRNSAPIQPAISEETAKARSEADRTRILLEQYKLAFAAVRTLANHLLSTFFSVFVAFGVLAGLALQGEIQGIQWTRWLIVPNFLVGFIFLVFYLYTYRRIDFNQEMSRLVEKQGNFEVPVSAIYDLRKRTWGIARSRFMALLIFLVLIASNTVLFIFLFRIVP